MTALKLRSFATTFSRSLRAPRNLQGPCRLLCCLAAALPLLGATLCCAQASTDLKHAEPRLQGSFGNIPLSFEPNRGQAVARVQFLSRGQGYALYLTPGEAVLELQNGLPAQTPGKTAAQPARQATSTLAMKLVGANHSALATARELLPGTVNYFIGNDQSKWKTALPTYKRIAYHSVYPGVDLVYYGNQRQLEYDFIVAPGADPSTIGLEFTGASPKIDLAGDLVLAIAAGETRFHKPVVYQMSGERKLPVEASYQLAEGKVRFAIGAYDHTQPLVIDPVLSYLTYLGGSADDQISGMAVDTQGNVVVVGTTHSTNFPLNNAYSSVAGQGGHYPHTMFVSKFNATGTALVYSTYLGDDTVGAAVAVDPSGNAYVFGTTNDPLYPVTPGAFQTICGANYAIVLNAGVRVTGCSIQNATGNNSTVLTKISPDGQQLVYSTYLSGNNSNTAKAIAVNAAGEAYVTGATNAYCPAPPYNTNGTGYQAYSCFPFTANAVDSGVTYGDTKLFLTKFNAQGSGLMYSSLLANHNPVGHYSSQIQANAIALDAAGNAYVAGYMDSNYYITTTPGSFEPTRSNGTSLPAFVAKFDPTGSATTSLVYSTYLTGTSYSNDIAYGIAVDGSGSAFVTGFTNSCTFPTTAGAFSTVPGNYGPNYCRGGFLTKFNPAGSGLVWSTYTGNNGANGYNNDNNDAVALAADGSVYVAGDEQSYSLSPTLNPLFAQNESHFTYLKHFAADGSAILLATPIGGATDAASIPTGLALDSAGNIYIAGYTNSPTWPTTAGAFQKTMGNPTTGNFYDGFLVKLAPTITTTTTLTLPSGPVTAGQPAIFIAMVAGPSGTTTTPTGTVTFSSGTTLLGTATLTSTGTATYTASTLNATTYNVTASYPGDSTFSPSVSAAQSLVVAPAVATVTLTAPATATPGASVILSVKVSGSSGTPTGSVTFMDGTTTLSTVTLASGAASYTSTAFAIGSHSLTASYTGDSIFGSATSSTQSLSIGLLVPTVTLTAPATALLGAPVILSASVAGTPGTPTGSVIFKDGSTVLSTVTLASGTASYTTSTLAAGSHTVTASYSGDATFSAVTSATTTVTVSVAPAISFAASPTSLTVVHGSSVTSVITGTPVGGYAGTVTFACGTLPAGASCTFNPTTLNFTGTNVAASTTLTFATTTTTSGFLQSLPGNRALGGILAALLLMPFALRRKQFAVRCRLLLLLAVVSGSMLMLGLGGCSGGTHPTTVTTAPGVYVVPVTVTAGTAVSTVNLSITVQ